MEWIDDAGRHAVTAICPRCGIDSVLGDQSGFPLTKAFLEEMQAHWFGSYRRPPTATSKGLDDFPV